MGTATPGDRVSHRVAVIPGDGAGPEVVAEARKAVNALAALMLRRRMSLDMVVAAEAND